MRLFVFMAMLFIAAAIGIHADSLEDTVAKICTNFVAAIIFVLAFYLPKFIGKEDNK